MKLRLQSDFVDFYDHWFDKESPHVFRRITTGGMDRYAMLRYLGENGCRTPKFGTCHSVAPLCKKVVVYTDLHSHCGEGKLLLDADEASAKYPMNLVAEYVGDFPGVSWRHLQIGKYGFWIEYRSNHDWRSNCGELVTMEIIGKETYFREHPLVAIDFVLGNELYAVDFNVAPGVRGTGVEDYLSPKEAAESVKQRYEELLDNKEAS